MVTALAFPILFSRADTPLPATDVLLIHCCWSNGWMDGWRWRDQTVYTCQELETRATCSNLNNSFYWLEYIDWLQIYSFLKLPSLLFLPPSLPPSLALSLRHPCFHLRCAVRSVRLQLMSVLAAASFHPAELLGCVCRFSCSVSKHSLQLCMHLCVCVCVCVSGCYWGNCYWLTLLRLHFFLFYWSHLFFFGPHLQGRGKSREDVLIFVQKLSVLALVVHGAVGLWAVGHQHQSAAARGAVEEALRTAVGQVVPQVRIWCDSPAVSCFYLFVF